MKLEVQIPKKFSIEILREQIESVKGDDISYMLREADSHYILIVQYATSAHYISFMEKLRLLW